MIKKDKKKKILFVTGTRADFGKLKSLIIACEEDETLETHIFVTGMHLLPRHGGTKHEVFKCNFKNIFTFINQRDVDSVDTIIANTIHGIGNYIQIVKPDLLVIHGDRIESLAGAIVGVLNNIPVAHIEGGEVSGTVDEMIRHSVSKLAHIHFVANDEAKNRLIQMGEEEKNIYIIGSPDLDLMISKKLPSLQSVREYYEIFFDPFAIFTFHPVTTSLHSLLGDINEVMTALLESGLNYVAIYPNNDPGAELIIEKLEQQRGSHRFRIFPSLQFESFLVLLKACRFIIGNSSAGIREAPFYGVPTINIGTRQNKRFNHTTIINVPEKKENILQAIETVRKNRFTYKASNHFGNGDSTGLFMQIIKNPGFWDIDVQKYFVDI